MNGAPLPVHHVVLIGLMGTGKSTVGRVLAKELDRDFVDTDAAIERDMQKDIAHIFTDEGEEFFRLQETSKLTDLLAEERPLVISTGGGILESELCRKLLAEKKSEGTLVVWLQASLGIMLERTARSQQRPLLAQAKDRNAREDVLKSLVTRRTPWYREAADMEISTDTMSIQRIVRTVISTINGSAL
ncbi:MAG: shikimate kinase [Actinomycetes bacterium]